MVKVTRLFTFGLLYASKLQTEGDIVRKQFTQTAFAIKKLHHKKGGLVSSFPCSDDFLPSLKNSTIVFNPTLFTVVRKLISKRGENS